MRSFISNDRAPAWYGKRGQVAGDQAILELRQNLQPLGESDEERLGNLRQLMAGDDDSCTRVAEAIGYALNTAHRYQQAASILRYWLMFYSRAHRYSV